MNIYEQLERDEGVMLRMYQDSVGVWTIGVGHNLEARPISSRAARLILQDDLADTKAALWAALPWAKELDEARQGVLLNMAFNLGVAGLLGFKNTLRAVHEQRWDDAAEGMLASKWATQVGVRARRLAKQMRTGEWV